MNTREDHLWKSLLAQSAPAFATSGAEEPPFGFATRVLAGARELRRAEALGYRTGLRAILAALCAVVALAVFTVVHVESQANAVDPAVQSMAQAENLQVS